MCAIEYEKESVLRKAQWEKEHPTKKNYAKDVD
jgi:hypothetical protein